MKGLIDGLFRPGKIRGFFHYVDLTGIGLGKKVWVGKLGFCWGDMYAEVWPFDRPGVHDGLDHDRFMISNKGGGRCMDVCLVPWRLNVQIWWREWWREEE